MNSLLKVSALLAGVAAAQGSGPYYTNGETGATYNYRMYHEFRGLDSTGNLYNSEPANITNDVESESATVQEGYLTSDSFAGDWNIMTWGSPASEEAPIRKQYSNQNVYVSRDEDGETHLTLRAYRNADFISSGEFDSEITNIFHASVNVRARVRGDPGTCAGIFTYANGENESDIEILTRDPETQIRYTNQPTVDDDGNEIPGASTIVDIPNGGVWSDWHDHRLDWTPELSAWYLDAELVHTKTYGIPQEPSQIIFNMWGDGGKWWTADMEIGAAAYLEIQYIEIFYNLAE
ncbi:concanavalin A-like lectin/glucanase domain-containing protein [Aspergillus karnatakaensis]|uniref:glycoside hydrolase family 16 protein n=1 Tax=Aspergillus karnatakaensis TaxID=1810916 RepID=UPI003CCE4EE0